MGWEYINSDVRLRRSERIMLRLNNAEAGGPVYGCAANTGGGSKGRIGKPIQGKTVDIEFQFPPKVLTDGRKGNWEEQEMPGGQEPFAVFVTSGPRELSLAWTYIVDSFDADNSDAWTVERITRNIRRLRGYFANVRDSNSTRDGLVVEFFMWCIGGTRPITARIKGIDVRYGDTLVFPPKLSDRAFPLRTDITLDIRVWTKGLIRESDGSVSGEVGDDVGIQDLEALVDVEPPDWY